MIIIEGPDRCGKTTIANHLKRLLPDWTMVHCTVPTRPVLEYHMDEIEAAGPKSIVDRLHWSEYAYGLTYRAHCGYDEMGWVAIEERLVEMKAEVLLLIDAPSRIKQRWGDQPFDAAHIAELCRHFTDLALGTGILRSKLDSSVATMLDYLHPDGSVRSAKLDNLAAVEMRKFA